MKKRILTIAFACTFITGLLTGCGSKPAENNTSAASTNVAASEEGTASDWADIQAKGKLVIGYTNYAPMNYFDDNNELTGFDTEYAKAVCEKLGVEPEFIEINWDTKEIELNNHNIDCIWNGFTISEDKKANLTYTNPYVDNKQVVIISVDNADKYVDAESLKGTSIAFEAGSAGETAATDELSDFTAVAVGKQTDALTEVKYKTSDAAVLDYTLAHAMIGEGTDYSDLMMIDGLDLAVEEYGIGCRLNSDLVDQINTATDELKADGTLPALAEKYDLSLAD